MKEKKERNNEWKKRKKKEKIIINEEQTSIENKDKRMKENKINRKEKERIKGHCECLNTELGWYSDSWLLFQSQTIWTWDAVLNPNQKPNAFYSYKSI